MIDWKRLIDVRERRRRLALETVHADRRAAEQGDGQVREARAALERCEDAKSGHWQAALADPALSVAQLSGAAAWSRVLDERIARERASVAEAAAHAQACARVLEASREALRRAAGGVEKADRMRERAQSLRRRLDDARVDAAAEEVAAARWRTRGA